MAGPDQRYDAGADRLGELAPSINDKGQVRGDRRPRGDLDLAPRGRISIPSGSTGGSSQGTVGGGS